MNREITFIHAADLHIDSPFRGLANTPAHIFQEIKESTFLALNRLVEAAIDKQVDFILITGDLFDNEKQSLKAQIRLKRAFECLKEENIKVYLSYGNHDYINGNIHKVTYPDNVHIFPDDTVRSLLYEKDGVPLVVISGFSYVNRAVNVNKTSEYKHSFPEAAYQIAMLHGSIQGNDEHDPYAPFHLSDLTSKDFDYWALGHIHKREVIKEDPYVVYPGNTQGRHRKETGEKGCYYIKLSNTKKEIDFIPLQSILFTPIKVDVSACNKAYQLENVIQRAVEQQAKDCPQLIDLTYYANHDALRSWQSEGQLEELIEIINETNNNKSPWQHIFRTSIQIEQEMMNADYYGEHFLGELQMHFDEGKAHEYLQELYEHRQARKYLEAFNELEERDVMEEARHQLFDKLLRGGEGR